MIKKPSFSLTSYTLVRQILWDTSNTAQPAALTSHTHTTQSRNTIEEPYHLLEKLGEERERGEGGRLKEAWLDNNVL